MRLLLLWLACAACAAPARLSRVPVGTYLLVIGDEPALDVFSPHSGTHVERFPVRGAPTALTVTRDGRKAVVAREGGLTVQPLFDDRSPSFHDLGVTPLAIATLDRRTRLATATPGELLVVDLRSGQVLARHGTGVAEPAHVAVDPQGEAVVVVDGTGVGCEVTLATGARVPVSGRTSPTQPPAGLLPGAGFLRRHPTLDLGFVTLPGEDRIAALTLPEGEVTGSFATGRGPRAIALTWSRRPLGGE